jgi:hypothetical protein
VSGCDCNCQLDGITKLNRPGYTTSKMETREKEGEVVCTVITPTNNN